MVSLLMPSFTHRHHSSRQLSDEDVQQSSIAHYALEACCPIIAHSSTDSVLKVYLASLVSVQRGVSVLCSIVIKELLCSLSGGADKPNVSKLAGDLKLTALLEYIVTVSVMFYIGIIYDDDISGRQYQL